MGGLRVGLPSGICAAVAAWFAAAVAASLAALLNGCGRLGYEDADDDAFALDDLASNAQRPTLVFTGSEFLVVWDDDRHGSNELYFARVAADGRRHGDEVRLTDAPGFSGHAQVAWSGSQLGVTWEDGRLGNDEVYFARFDGSGAAIGGQNPLSNAIAGQLLHGQAYNPSIAWGGSEFAVGWEDVVDGGAGGTGGESEIYFARTGADNLPVETPLQLTSASGRSTRSSLAWTGSEFGVAWDDNRGGAMEMFFARCAADGTLIGSELAQTNAGASALGAQLVWNGSSYGLAWADSRGGAYAIYFARLLADGTQVGAEIQVSRGADDASEASLVWAADHWAVAYVQSGRVKLVELPAQALPPGRPRRVGGETGDAASPRLVWADGSYGLVWQDHRSGDWDVYFREVAP